MTLTETMFVHHKTHIISVNVFQIPFVLFIQLFLNVNTTLFRTFCVAQHCELYMGSVGSQTTVKALWQGMDTEVWGVW